MSAGNRGKGGVRRPFNSVTSPWHRQCVKITSSSVCVGRERKLFEMAVKYLMGIIFLIVIVGTCTMAKSYSDTDLTSDITSTGYDQYPWSVLAPRRGPTVQDTLEWKWTANDRSEKGPIDKFLQSPWKKSSLLNTKHNARSMSSNKKIEDKGPGSLEIYKLPNLDETDLNLLTQWSTPELRKKLHQKFPKKSLSQKPQKPKKTSKIIPSDNLNQSQTVPELQIGCEGLEAPLEPSIRDPRSISPTKNTTKDDNPLIDSVIPPVSPVTIDWHYEDRNAPRNYDEMDELLKLKKKEGIKKPKNRSDIPPEEDTIDYDFKKVPTRGDLVSRKTRSLDRNRNTNRNRNRNEEPWGFGEDDGYISGNDDDEDNSAQRVEADRRRQEYEKMRREEMERRRNMMMERERVRQEELRRRNQELSEIDRIRNEYENRQSEEQREQERKLKEYIERNRPIVVEDLEARNRRLQEEFRRRAEVSRNDPSGRNDHSRGPSPPNGSQEDFRRNEEWMRRREEEERLGNEERNRRIQEERRREEERRQREREEEYERNRRLKEERTRQEVARLQANEERIRKLEEEMRKTVEARIRADEARDERNRRLQEERRREEEQRRIQEEARKRLMEQIQKPSEIINLNQAQRKEWEERRLNSLPVNARIVIDPNFPRSRGSTESPLFGSRGNFDNDVDLPAINPNRPGLSATRFPAARTPKPPSNSPSSCVWAIAHCCPNSDQRRLSNCFEHLGCPGVSWDTNPCRGEIINAANAEIRRFYASTDQP